MILTRTPLRISFAGGGSDLPSHYEEFGGAVLSATLNKYVYITAKHVNPDVFSHRYRLVYSQVEERSKSIKIEHPIIQKLIRQYGINSLDLDIMSDIPAGTGLGSSSAFTVGLHKTLGYSADKYALAEAACRTEIVDLKEPIGKQDQYAAAFGGLNYFTFSRGGVDVYPISLPSDKLMRLQSRLFLVYIGGIRSASDQLKQQKHNSKDLNELADLAHDLYGELTCGYIDSVGEIMKEAWAIKKSLSKVISTPLADYLIDEAIKAGATGGKLLGAGGGGFVLLYVPAHCRNQVRDVIEDMNLRIVDFRFDMEGSKVLYAD